MVSRRPARVFALQALYASEISANPLAQVLVGVLEANPINDDQKSFGMRIIDLFQEHQAIIRADLEELTKHWSFDRMATIDRLLLQIGMVELRFFSETPAKVILNECTEIAKKYSTAESAGFVNGVLKAYAQKHQLIG